MAIQFGTVDGLVNITKKPILCFVKGIDEFVTQGGPNYAKGKGISFGAAFQRYIEPVYEDETKSYTLSSIDVPVYTSSGAEQSPARITFCKKMGLLKINESSDLFEFTPLGKAILDDEITIEEYAFILLSKMGVFKDGVYADNLLNIISLYFQSNAIISQSSLKDFITNSFNDSNFTKTRFDIIINALTATGLITKVSNDNYVLSGTGQAELLADYNKRSKSLSIAEIDTSSDYSNYIGNLEYGGVFDVLFNDNIDIYTKFFPNLRKYIKTKKNMMASSNNFSEIGSLQQIFYGAPGTGKSHEIKRRTEEKAVVRTTFHPDSDYSTFVGAYKPAMKENVISKNGVETKEEQIVYRFTPQAFVNAYVKAWNTEEDVFLIIEEINRGNCAQIFGDLFQLLDRGNDGRSEYPVDADSDLASHIAKELAGSSRTDFPDEVKEGKKLVLPNNLYIWATMNTSDQSLFPIDSAFKRRWDWKYIKISEGTKNDGSVLGWKILVEDEEQDRVRLYDWWKFLQLINAKIFGATQSADKQMGYFFTKATETFNGEKIGTLNGEEIVEQSGSVSHDFISAETFVNKVLFYLWTDVLKDNEYEEIASLMKDGDQELSFHDFFDETGKDINARAVRAFLDNVVKNEDSKCEIAEWSYEGQNNQTSFKPKSMIIKITDNIQDENALYQRAKGWWWMAEKKADTNVIEYVYIYSTPVRKIVACYHVSKWDSIVGSDGKKRFGFEGVSVKDAMIGQSVDMVAHSRGQVVFYPQ